MGIRSVTYPPSWSHGALGAGRFKRLFNKGINRIGRGIKKVAMNKTIRQIGKNLGNELLSSGVQTATQLISGQDPKKVLLQNSKQLAKTLRNQAVDAGLNTLNDKIAPALKQKLPDQLVDIGVKTFNEKAVPALKRKLLGDESFGKKRKKLFN